jgi:ABC-type uncharacterized transport system substrate-binding protein
LYGVESQVDISVYRWIVSPKKVTHGLFNSAYERQAMRKSLPLLLIFVALVVGPAKAEAQQPKKVPRIGFLSGRGAPSPTNPDPSAEAFRQGLRDLGYIEGKNIRVEYRYAEGKLDRIPSLVAELVQLNVDVLVSPAGPAIRAAKQATKTIPIVMVITGDPVATGLIDSLARPGGNITGLTRPHPRAKRKTAGIAYGGSSRDITHCSPLVCHTRAGDL